MNTYYIAIDIGASSGRHVLAHLENGALVFKEIYQFSNGMTEINGEKCWDTKALFADIKNGMKWCKKLEKIPVSMGIDTWGSRFCALR